MMQVTTDSNAEKIKILHNTFYFAVSRLSSFHQNRSRLAALLGGNCSAFTLCWEHIEPLFCGNCECLERMEPTDKWQGGNLCCWEAFLWMFFFPPLCLTVGIKPFQANHSHFYVFMWKLRAYDTLDFRFLFKIGCNRSPTSPFTHTSGPDTMIVASA